MLLDHITITAQESPALEKVTPEDAISLINIKYLFYEFKD
jgi:hypothetical protein